MRYNPHIVRHIGNRIAIIDAYDKIVFMINQLHSENHSGGAAIGVAFFYFQGAEKHKNQSE